MKKLFTLLANDIFIVILLGIVSTATAWSGVQSSLHGGVSDEALTNYQLSLADANNMWITAEVKYRDDLSVWKDKQVRLMIDGVNMLSGRYGVRNGHYALKVEHMNQPPLQHTEDFEGATAGQYLGSLDMPAQAQSDLANAAMALSQLDQQIQKSEGDV